MTLETLRPCSRAKDRASIYAEVLRRLNDDAIGIWLYDRQRVDAFRATIAGYQANPWDQATWNIQDWYLSRAR